MHLWDGIYSDTTIENNIKGYGELIKIAEENEIDLYIENVVCNHHDPLSNWKRLLNEYPDAKLIFDTKWQLSIIKWKPYMKIKIKNYGKTT